MVLLWALRLQTPSSWMLNRGRGIILLRPIRGRECSCGNRYWTSAQLAVRSWSNQVIKRCFLHQSPEQTWPRACHTNGGETKSGAVQTGKAHRPLPTSKTGIFCLRSLFAGTPLPPETQRSAKASGQKPQRTYHQEAGLVWSEVVCLKEIKEKEREIGF